MDSLSRSKVQEIPKCHGCGQEIVTETPLLILHDHHSQCWHTSCHNIQKTWNVTQRTAIEMFGNQIGSFDCVAQWEMEVAKIWKVMNEFEAALITNYLIFKEQIKKPKATLTLECCSVLLEHTHELLRTAERISDQQTCQQKKEMKSSLEQLIDLDSALIHFLTEVTHFEEVLSLTVNRVKLLLKESMHDIKQLFTFVVAGLITLPMDKLGYFLRQINLRIYNLALKPQLLPAHCARTLEVDALSLQNIKWRHSLIEMNRYSAESENHSLLFHSHSNDELQIYRKVSLRRPVSRLEFRKGSLVTEHPFPYVQENDYSPEMDVKEENRSNAVVRIPHVVFALDIPVPKSDQPKATKISAFKRISSFQTLTDESDSGIGVGSLLPDLPVLEHTENHTKLPASKSWYKKAIKKWSKLCDYFYSIAA
jgi:hypothetical protein